MKQTLTSYLYIVITTLILLWILKEFISLPIGAPRAIWIWEEDSFHLLDNERLQREIETFLKQRHISTIYLYADEFKGRNILLHEPEKYQKLIATAHGRGFKVFALLGSGYLQSQTYILPTKRAIALRTFANVLNFNKNSPDALSQFDGINIDIEPHLLGDWVANRALYSQQYLDLSKIFMRMKAVFGSTLLVGPAIPPWYQKIHVEWNERECKLNECIQDIYDYVALMDYRNVAQGPDSIVSNARNILRYADKIGKQVKIGVETLNITPAKATFYGKGNPYFETQLALAQAALSSHPSFSGFVIHHLSSYQVLVEDKSSE